MRSLLKSLRFAGKGISHTLSTQRNMRIHVVIGTLAIIVGFVLCLEPLEWTTLLIMIGLALSFECLNTSLEAIVDRASPEQHPLARIAKDSAAGAVLIMAVTAIIVGVIIYGTALLRILA
jgi:diacylglycerol kinase